MIDKSGIAWGNEIGDIYGFEHDVHNNFIIDRECLKHYEKPENVIGFRLGEDLWAYPQDAVVCEHHKADGCWQCIRDFHLLLIYGFLGLVVSSLLYRLFID